MSETKKGLTSVIITIIIIMMLILSSPASAVIVTLTIPQSVEQGQTLNFNLNVTLQSSEHIPITNITFILKNDSYNKTFAIYPNGTGISGDISATVTENTTIYQPSDYYGYGYGYGSSGFAYYNLTIGYGYGFGYNAAISRLLYSVSIATSSLSIGNYKIQAWVYTGLGDPVAFVSEETSFEIKSPAPTPSEGGAPAVGGAGPVVGEPYENVAVKEVHYILTVKPNEHIITQFARNHSVAKIGFTYLTTVDEVSITVEKLIDRSLLVNISPPGVVFEYVNIWVYVPNPAQLANCTIEIKVDKAWIAANNINPASIAIYRYKEGAWSKLETVKLSEDDKFILFRASTPGFSPFAITGEKMAPTPVPTLITPTPVPTKTPTPLPTATATPTPEPGIEENEILPYIFITGIIGGIVGFGLIVMLIVRMREGI